MKDNDDNYEHKKTKTLLFLTIDTQSDIVIIIIKVGQVFSRK